MHLHLGRYNVHLERHSTTSGVHSTMHLKKCHVVCVQGREKDVCIFTTVRSRLQGGIGFVADARRINVGLSRARCSLLVVGNSTSLRRDKKWAGLVSYAESIGCTSCLTVCHIPCPDPLPFTSTWFLSVCLSPTPVLVWVMR
jgi:hypothetical protein